MKYEVKSAEWAFLKTIIVFIFYFVVLFITMFGFMQILHEDEEITELVKKLLCYPIFNKDNPVDTLYIFVNSYLVLFFAVFHLSEHIYFHNNIALRYNQKKWVIHKYIVGICFILIFSLLQYLSIFYVFHSYMPTSLKYYIYPIVYRIMIMSSVYTLYNMLNTNKIACIVLLLLLLYPLLHFNIYLSLAIIIGTFIINFMFFNLRTFKYLNIIKRKEAR